MCALVAHGAPYARAPAYLLATHCKEAHPASRCVFFTDDPSHKPTRPPIERIIILARGQGGRVCKGAMPPRKGLSPTSMRLDSKNTVPRKGWQRTQLQPDHSPPGSGSAVCESVPAGRPSGVTAPGARVGMRFRVGCARARHRA